MHSRASICSSILIIPISAAIADPALPVTISAERTGPSSRINDNPTADPNQPSEPNLVKCMVALQSEHHTGESGGKAYNNERLGTYELYLLYSGPEFSRRQENPANRVGKKQSHAACEITCPKRKRQWTG